MDKLIIKKIIGLLIFWRLGLFGLSWLAPSLLMYQPSFPYAYDLLAQLGLPQWLYSWTNFDGVHYLTIMRHGYIGTGLIQAFFPFFPLFVGLFTPAIPEVIMTLILNLFTTGLSLYFLFLLVARHHASSVAWLSLCLLLIFPTSFYLGAVYSEAFFLCFVLGALLAADKQRWLLATLAAALAISTRLVGIFILPALVVQLFADVPLRQLPSSIKKNIHILLLLSLSLFGLFAFMSFLQFEFSDPLYFFHVQSEFGSGRQESLILLPQTLWRGIKIVATVPLSRIWLTYAQELLFTLVSAVTLVIGVWQRRSLKLPLSWLVFALGVVLLPTLTGTLSSMPRYILVAFPLYIIWAQFLQKYKVTRGILMVLSLSLLIYNTVLFIQGYWVA